MSKPRYRLGLDLGSTSIGWAVIRINDEVPPEPTAIIRAGARIFGDGRNPKDGTSLAVTRRNARAMRRRRDRLLKRKERMIRLLIEHGFFPADADARRLLESLNPYALRAKALDEALTPAEFGRALFHINQRRGFKSNRKTDKDDNDSGALKGAVQRVRGDLDLEGKEGKARTVGELLYRRFTDINVGPEARTVRARYREVRVLKDDGKTKIDKRYDLYIDRAMIEAEFDAIWHKQAALNPETFRNEAGVALKDCLLHQRDLRPVMPGRCTLMPEEPRAPLALPSQQRFRIYQELSNLCLLGGGLSEVRLDISQRDKVAHALERGSQTFKSAIPKLLGLPGNVRFNLADEKRAELKGNTTSMALSKKQHFGDRWFSLPLELQDKIVMQLLSEENESKLIAWLAAQAGLEEKNAEAVSKARLAEGYGSLSAAALEKILPAFEREVLTYDKAVLAGGFAHHSHIAHAATGEILPELPYYGEYLQRHVGFGTQKKEDAAERRFGKIANPTVHIGLNQVRAVVNALIRQYGHPAQVIVEVARELKQNQEQRRNEQEQQAKNQRRNERLRTLAAETMQISVERVRHADLQKLILWEELSFDPAMRRCPYSGVQLGAHMVLSEQVEIEHILPFSRTLDDGLNNKTVAMRQANRIKGNRTPWEARLDFEAQGWPTADMLTRAAAMPLHKRYRFAEDGYQKWLREDKDFLARALNDTRYLSRVAREYLSLICPQDTRVIPGQMTAMLRGKFALNNVLGLNGEKNRNDHRHHAVDACVIAVTDQGMLNRFAQASGSARERQLNRLVDDMPLPWPTYRAHVERAVANIVVSHKPDHGYQGAMHEASAWGFLPGGQATRRSRGGDGIRTREVKTLKLVPISSTSNHARHGLDADGTSRAYKGYVGGSNFCIEIVRNDSGKWEGEVVSTFDAYQMVRNFGEAGAISKLRATTHSVSKRPLVMRLHIDDAVRLLIDDKLCLMRVAVCKSNGQVILASHTEANVDQRNRDKADPFTYTTKFASSLQKANARRVSVSPSGELSDPGFPG